MMSVIMGKKKFDNPRERFLEVAEARTNAILDKIRVLGHCSNKSLYSYTQEEINKIFKTIEEELNLTKDKFKHDQLRKRKFKL